MSFSNQQILEGTNDRFRVEFNEGLSAPHADLDLLASRDTDANIEVGEDEIKLYLPQYNPDMDLYDGEVKYDGGKVLVVSMVGKEYARGYAASLTELKNPVKREIHAHNVRQLGVAANNTKLKLGMGMILEGDTAKHGSCYDGQMLFDTDHPGVNPYKRVVSQSNLFEGFELTLDNVVAVLMTMTLYSNHVGQPFGNDWTGGQNEPTFRLWHGPALEKRVAELKMPDPMKQNPLAGTFVAKKSPYFVDDYAQWWMVQFLAAGLPLASVDIDAYIESQVDRGEKKQAKYQAHAEFAMGYRDWHGVALARP